MKTYIIKGEYFALLFNVRNVVYDLFLWSTKGFLYFYCDVFLEYDVVCIFQ